MGIAASRMTSWLIARVRARQLLLAATALALTLCGVVASPAGAAAATTPVRAVFYQPWSAGSWPRSLPEEPLLGRYDSSAEATVAQQVEWMSYARLDAAIASWDGQGSPADSAF